MTPDEAEALAARTYAAIDGAPLGHSPWERNVLAADRERVASDLAGLQRHAQQDGVLSSGVVGRACPVDGRWEWCEDYRDREAGLRRTAALYGVS